MAAVHPSDAAILNKYCQDKDLFTSPSCVSDAQLLVPNKFLPNEQNQDVRHQQFVERCITDLNLVCSSCLSIPSPNAIFTGHCRMTICSDCLDKHFASYPNKCMCNKPARKDWFYRNHQGAMMVKELRAKCAFGCGMTGTISETVEHQNLCPSRPAVCSTCKEIYLMSKKAEHDTTTCIVTCPDCSQKVIICDMKTIHKQESCFQNCPHCRTEHLTITLPQHKAECDKRPFTCKCGTTIQFCNIDVHRLHCSKELVECPNGCKAVYERENGQQHNHVCGNVEVQCTICPHKCLRRDMPEHEADTVFHWKQHMKEQREINVQHQRQLDILKSTNEQILKQVNQTSVVLGAAVSRLENNLGTHREETTRDLAALKVEAGILRRVCDDVTYLMRKQDNVPMPVRPEPVAGKPSQAATAVLVASEPSQATAAELIAKALWSQRRPESVAAKPSQATAAEPVVAKTLGLPWESPTAPRGVRGAPLGVGKALLSQQRPEPVAGKPSQAAAANAFWSQQALVTQRETFGVSNVRTTNSSLFAQVMREKPVSYNHNVAELRGCKVKPGPKWCHGNENGSGIGIILNIFYRQGAYFAEVRWENGTEKHYCIDGESHELMFD